MQQRYRFQQLFHHIVSTTVSLFRGLAGSALPLLAVAGMSLAAFSNALASTPSKLLEMPDEYGKVIYRINADSPRQLYIIAIRHRSPETPTTAGGTVRTQMEIFRIGEWLRQNANLNLLLPEGYFNVLQEGYAANDNGAALGNTQPAARLDNKVLRQKLGSTTTFVNAEMLLMEYLCLPASQVEDRDIYDAVRGHLKRLNTIDRKHSTFRRIADELRYLQKVRTASLLQKIPAVIEKEVHRGTIANHTALFTIGLSHIEDIYTSIDRNHIQIQSPSTAEKADSFSHSGLNLLDSGYGITIILPQTLATDSDLLKMTRIDRLTLASTIDSE